MKNLFLSLVTTLLLVPAMASPMVPAKTLLVKFYHSFPCAANTSWYESKGNYEVRFEMDNARCWLGMNRKNGNQEWLIKYYDGSNLDPALNKALQSDYPGTTISCVTQIDLPSGTYYSVNLKDKKNIYVVIMDSDGNTSLRQKFIDAGTDALGGGTGKAQL